MKKQVISLGIIGALIATVLSGCGDQITAEVSSYDYEPVSSYEEVSSENTEENFLTMFPELDYTSYSEIESDGSCLTIDTNPYDEEEWANDWQTTALVAIERVNEKLGFSKALYQKMISTRALDGIQTDENDNYEVSWSYHPDDGLLVNYEVKY